MKSIIAVPVSLVVLFAGNVHAKEPSAAEIREAKGVMETAFVLIAKSTADIVCEKGETFLKTEGPKADLLVVGDHIKVSLELYEGVMAEGIIDMKCLKGVLYQFNSRFQVYGEPVLENTVFRGKLK